MATNITAMVKASTFYTVAADLDFVDGETIVIGGKTYTAKATLTDTDGYFQLGASNDRVATLLALSKAVNLSGIADTDYAALTTRNPYVDATYPGSGDVLTVTARVTGAIGNLITAAVGTSAATVDNATFENGAGDIDVFITEMQAGFQLNAAMIEAFAQAQA